MTADLRLAAVLDTVQDEVGDTGPVTDPAGRLAQLTDAVDALAMTLAVPGSVTTDADVVEQLVQVAAEAVTWAVSLTPHDDDPDEETP